MKNIEKYKDDILNAEITRINFCVNYLSNKGICFKNCKDCKKAAMEWLLSEYKEPILDEVEKKYLSAVIKPFRKNVLYISKIEKGYVPDSCFIAIELNGYERINLPYFNIKSGMYVGMQPFVKYSLEELGL